MPELPEVETVRRGLEPHVVGGFIDDIEVGDSKVFQIEPHRLLEQIRGQKILGLTRRTLYRREESARAGKPARTTSARSH